MQSFSLVSFFQVILKDLFKYTEPVENPNIHFLAAIDWLKNAQDINNDNGVSAWYGFWRGWAPSFIETTGYIIPTFIAASHLSKGDLLIRAKKMGYFLISMQMVSGAFRAYSPPHPKSEDSYIFNTGQDIIGLCALFKETQNQDFLISAIKAADYLITAQSNDGSWVDSFDMKPHAYHSRVAYALVCVFDITRDNRYANAAKLNLEWVLSVQNKNGWFNNNRLPKFPSATPILHTISYACEGMLYSGIILKNNKYINSAKLCADHLLNYYLKNNRLPATFDSNWIPTDSYLCLTGISQISTVWLELYKITNDKKYLIAAKKANRLICSTQIMNSDDKAIRGGIKGSHPIYGDLIRTSGYCRLSYPNWAAKFFIDSLLTQIEIESWKKL